MDETLSPPAANQESLPDHSNWHFRVEEAGGEATIYLPPELEIKDAQTLEKIVNRHLQSPDIRRIRIDLSQNSMLDAATFGGIVRARKAIKEKTLDKVITFRGVNSPQANELFDKNGMRDLFEFEEPPKE